MPPFLEDHERVIKEEDKTDEREARAKGTKENGLESGCDFGLLC